MFLGLIVGTIFCFVGTILIAQYDDSREFFGIILTIIGGIVIGWIISEGTNTKALDVYRGKTELESTETVRDSVVVKIDSVVVWKDKVKEE